MPADGHENAARGRLPERRFSFGPEPARRPAPELSGESCPPVDS